MAVWYEWVVETTALDDAGILDVNHYDTYAGAKEYADRAGDTDGDGVPVVQVIGLVRDSDTRGSNRSWAYIEDGALPSHFSDAYDNQTAKVPQRFFKEVLTPIV